MLAGFSMNCQSDDNSCWNGIRPGHSTLAEVREHLNELGYTIGSVNTSLRYQYFYSQALMPGCVKVGYSPDEKHVSYLRLYCFRNLSIGHVMSQFGVPRSVAYRFSPFGDAEFLTFDAERNLSGIAINIGLGWQLPNSPVTSIDLFQTDDLDNAEIVTGSWHGFASMRRYCQFEPAYPRCH